MLVLPIKAAVRYDLAKALSNWLDDSNQHVSFQPTNPLQLILPKPDFTSAMCRVELVRLQSVRNCLSDCLLKSDSHKNALDEGALDDCHEYHAILLEFEKRGFPTYDDEMVPITLTWKGAFGTQRQEKHGTLIWERACIAFNVCALLTHKASSCSTTDRDECKQGVGFCQQAASILTILNDLCQTQQFSTVDLSSSMLSFWAKLLTAEAQLFIYRMASLGAPSSSSPHDTAQHHGTLAKLSQSAYSLFNNALLATHDPRLQSEVPKQCHEWGTHCKSAGMLAAARADYHWSVTQRVAGAWGTEVAALRSCRHKLDECAAFFGTATNVDSYAHRECLAIAPVVTDRLYEADADNLRLYHDEIPAALPAIPARQLAKVAPHLPSSMLIPKKALFTGLT